MISLALIAASTLPVAVSVHQDGILECNDGDRYTSCRSQPFPFHRRFHQWPKRLLQGLTMASLVALGLSMGDWKRALLLLALPGAWFAATHPTTVDAPLMLLAWWSAHFVHTNPAASIALAIVAGVIHERGPVFAAIYAFHPLPLLGLLAVQWWVKPAKPDQDKLVGIGTWGAIKAHRPYQDFLDGKVVWTAMRATLPAALYFGSSPRAWAAFAIANLTRIIGTDTCRFLFWAAPPFIVDMPDLPVWIVAVHVATFRRAI